MKQEIALKNGNFCGVCPVIGRLREPIRCVYRRGEESADKSCRSFFMARSDTHGKAVGDLDRTQRNTEN